jgi:hypothetical protein
MKKPHIYKLRHTGWWACNGCVDRSPAGAYALWARHHRERMS